MCISYKRDAYVQVFLMFSIFYKTDVSIFFMNEAPDVALIDVFFHGEKSNNHTLKGGIKNGYIIFLHC